MIMHWKTKRQHVKKSFYHFTITKGGVETDKLADVQFVEESDGKRSKIEFDTSTYLDGLKDHCNKAQAPRPHPVLHGPTGELFNAAKSSMRLFASCQSCAFFVQKERKPLPS